jgi:hypothetical protein
LGCSIWSSASPTSLGAAVICFFGFATSARYRGGPETASQHLVVDLESPEKSRGNQMFSQLALPSVCQLS